MRWRWPWVRLNAAAWLAAAACSGVASPTTPATVDAGGLSDGGSRDGGGGPAGDAGASDAGTAGVRDGGASECLAPTDCELLPEPGSVGWCRTSRWSCVLGRCTWECRGGRTCTRTAQGCLACREDGGAAAAPSCPGDPCAEGLFQADAGATMEQPTCVRPFHLEVAACYGEAVDLHDGTTCTLQSLFTGLPRAVLSCGRCQTTLTR